MDFISHLLIGIIFVNVFSLSLINLVLFLVGSILLDFPVILIYFYYSDRKLPRFSDILDGGEKALHNFIKDKKKKPEKLFFLYDFFHSIFFILIIFLLSFFYESFLFLAMGALIHILIDIPTHKKHSPAIFFPWKFRIKGLVDWFTIYSSLKSRIVVWGILMFLILISYLIFR